MVAEQSIPREGKPAGRAAPERRTYDYDHIGNRTESAEAGGTAVTYTRTNVNEYSQTSVTNDAFAYDDDGNLTEDIRYTYVWDGENRLTEVRTRDDLGGNPTGPDNGDLKLRFTYDYMSRRVRKERLQYNGSAWVVNLDQKFIYDGWNVVMVLDGTDEDAVLRKYTWGLDLSGTLDGSGGIGGLLAVVETQGAQAGSYWYFYDGNGNVGQLLDATTPTDPTVEGYYEYDPYGNTIGTVPGGYAATNRIRFSTKWLDKELTPGTTAGAIGSVGLCYYGYRYYSPRLGRWLSKDPLAERGGRNLYAFLANDAPSRVDPHGLQYLETGLALEMAKNLHPTPIWYINDCKDKYDVVEKTAKKACECIGKVATLASDRGKWDAAAKKCPQLYPFNAWALGEADDTTRTSFLFSLLKVNNACSETGFGLQCECSCKKDVHAWVRIYTLFGLPLFASGPIHICDDYFKDPNGDTGRSKTIIHELVHWTGGYDEEPSNWVFHPEHIGEAVMSICNNFERCTQ